MQIKSLLNLSLAVVMLTGLSACQSSDDEVTTTITTKLIRKGKVQSTTTMCV